MNSMSDYPGLGRAESVRRYLLGVAAVAIGVAVRIAVDPELHDGRLPFFTLFPAVFFAAWFGGFGPALLATALSMLAAWTMFYVPVVEGAAVDGLRAMSFALFAVIGAACGWLGQARLNEHTAATRATVTARAAAARAEEEAMLARLQRARAEEEAARAETALAAFRESESRFKTLADGAPVLIWVNGPEGCEFVNQPYLDFIGVSGPVGVRGYDWAAYIHPEDRDDYIQGYTCAFQARTDFEAQFRFRRHDGEYRWMKSAGRPRYDASGAFIGYIGSTVDVTDLKEAEAQVRAGEERLRQSAKMEAIGRLAGGLAHDFNNQLYAVAGFAEFVSKDLGLTPRARQDLLQLRSAVERMAGLTRQLLAFSRQQVLTPETLDLNRTIAEVQPMLERLIGRNVSMIVELAERPLWVRVDPSQLTQLLLNLSINARDAMPEGGEVHLSTAARDLTKGERLAGGASVTEGRYAELVVRDSGSGIRPEHLPRIFEPFFTTKPIGQGTGLGLATVHGIVAQSGGHVWAASADGRGAAFTVLLPLADPPPLTLPDENRESQTSDRARILVVDDEDLVRSVLVRSLEDEGYVVLQARDGREALERLAEHDRVDLVVSDLVMPVMSGRELAVELSARHPTLPVVWVSGHPWEADPGGDAHWLEQPFLQKPVPSTVLHDTVTQVLRQARRLRPV
jgi:PAS domain S-box-containing protein